MISTIFKFIIDNTFNKFAKDACDLNLKLKKN